MKNHDYKYSSVYSHFKKMIEEGVLAKGDRMPSLLVCAQELSVSKTTVENAYFQLLADGYIISRERSGYYVTGGMVKPRELPKPSSGEQDNCMAQDCRYDLATIGDDGDAFRFELWQRYLKSAIRHKERMITYGEPQGEQELREAICEYVRKRRNIYCNPDSIVIGASTQSLLMILLPILKEQGMSTASVPAEGFERFGQVFRSYGLQVDIRKKESDVIYVSPSHMTVWGKIMSLSRRYEILEHRKHGHLIIEDDYQNEFVFAKQGIPSIYALAGGDHVVYLGSFSRILLPSIRISYMILSNELAGAYRKVMDLYDQTASKTEQLALCSYLRDEHLYRQIRKLRKIYTVKRTLLFQVLSDFCKGISDLTILAGEGGTEMAVKGETGKLQILKDRLIGHKICFREMEDSRENGVQTLLFSCGRIDITDLQELRDQGGYYETGTHCNVCK